MSGTNAIESAADPASVAAVLQDAAFVTLLAGADGDGLAAGGLLAHALRILDTPFHFRVTDVPDRVIAERGELNDDTADSGAPPAEPTIVLGQQTEAATATVPGLSQNSRSESDDPPTPASATAYTVARELGADADPVVALAGAIAAGVVPGTAGTDDILEAAQTRGLVERQSGVALQTGDLADSLAHSTLFVAPFSGDLEQTKATLEEWDLPQSMNESARKRFASLLAIEVATDPEASTSAATAVERALGAYEIHDGPFASVEGYADLLDVLTRADPGTGIALAMRGASSLSTEKLDSTGSETGGRNSSLLSAAQSAWRRHAREAHRALRSAQTGRYDGSVLARVDTDPSVLPTVARLLLSYRSPESTVLVLNENPVDDEQDEGADGSAGRFVAAASCRDPVGLDAVLSAAAEDYDGTGYGTPRRAQARYDGDPTAFAAAVREEL